MLQDEPDFEISTTTVHQQTAIFDRMKKVRWILVPFVVLIVVLIFVLLFAQQGKSTVAVGTYRPTATSSTESTATSSTEPTPTFSTEPTPAFSTEPTPTSSTAPTPTSSIAPTPIALSTSIPKFGIGTNASGGTLTVNGKTFAFDAYDSNRPIVLKLQPTVIILRSPPFQPLTCTIDTTTPVGNPNPERCGLQNKIVNDSTGNFSIPILDMNLTLADLPAKPSQQFAAFIQTKLASFNAVQVTVPVGEHYATGIDSAFVPTADIAQSALSAQSWAVQPVTNSLSSSECSHDGICPTHGLVGMPTQGGHVFVTFTMDVNVGWRFFDSTGQQVASFMPHDSDPTLPGPQLRLYQGVTMTLTYVEATGWQDVSDFAGGFAGAGTLNEGAITNDLCGAGAALVGYLLSKETPANSFGMLVQRSVTSGCLIDVIPSSSPPFNVTSINPVTDTYGAWYLSHFGTVLAVNDKAHALFPQLPRATASEATEVWKASQQP